MKSLVLALGLFFCQQGGASDPEWIVIYNTQSQGVLDPVINVRVVIRARSEGDAVKRSVILLQNKFGVNITETMDFVEAALRKP